MLNRLLRIYQNIPAAKRARIREIGASIISDVPPVEWLYRKTVLRWYYLHGQPRGISIELTDKCNLKCHYCPKSLDIGIKGSHMEYGLFKKTVDEALSEGRLDRALLVGFGEPFLYPHLEDAVAYIKQRSPGTKVTLTSNGTLLSGEIGTRLARAGLDQITISVNATSREQYHRINAADEYDKVVANTTAFLDAVNAETSSMTVFVQVLEVLNDEAQIKKFYEFWTPRLGNCGIIQRQPFVNWGGQIDTQRIIDGEDAARSGKAQRPASLKEMKKAIDPTKSAFEHDTAERSAEPYPCLHLQMSRIVSREGNALACCMVYPDEQGDLALGNVRDAPLERIYNEGRIKELQLLDMQGKLGTLTPCNTCEAYKTVPNIWLKNPLHKLVGQKFY